MTRIRQPSLFDGPKPRGPRRPAVRGNRWHCYDCREVFKFWAPAQRHADETGHHRIALDIDEVEP